MKPDTRCRQAGPGNVPWGWVALLLVCVLFPGAIGPAFAAPSRLRGRVFDPSGEPQAGAWVQLQTLDPDAPMESRTGGWELASGFTGADGAFEVTLPPPGTPFALLALHGTLLAWREFPRAEAPTVADAIDVELRPWPRLEAMVRAMDGSPLGHGVGVEVIARAGRRPPAMAGAPGGIAAPDGARPGLVAEFHVAPEDADLEDPRLFSGQPLFRRIEARIEHPGREGHFANSGLEDYFAVRWTGRIGIPEAGTYGFAANSDDAVEVRVDGRPVISDRAIHAARTARGSVTLSAGFHEFEVRFFEGTAVQVCVVSWTPPGGREEVIPATAFSHETRHARGEARGEALPPRRQFTGHDGTLSLPWLPGVRHESVRHLGAGGWRELIAARQLLVAPSLGSRSATLRVTPMEKGRWRLLGTADGLPSDEVRRILFARDGAAWFATDSGVARYDGRTMRPFSHEDGLLDDGVYSLAESDDGHLWVGSVGGASELLPEGGARTWTEREGLAPGMVFQIQPDARGRIWFRTGLGLCWMEGGRIHLVPGQHELRRAKSRGMVVGGDGRVWFVPRDTGPLAVWDGAELKSVGADLIRDDDAVDLLGFDSQGRLGFRLGTRGWARLEGERAVAVGEDELPPFPVGQVIADLSEPNGRRWWGTAADGLLLDDGRMAVRFGAPSPLPHPQVSDLRLAPDGAVWVATPSGVLRYETGTLSTFTKADGLPGAGATWGIAVDDAGGVWAGTEEGLWHHSGQRASILGRESGLAGYGVRQLRTGRDGAVWFAELGTGFVRLQRGERRAYRVADGLPGSHVHGRFTQGPDGAWWLPCWQGGNFAGLARLVPETGPGTAPVVRTYSPAEIFGHDHRLPPDAGPYAVEFAGDGQLWLGTAGAGVLAFDGTAFRVAPGTESLTNRHVYALTRDVDGSMWLATEGMGAVQVRGGRVVEMHRARRGGLASDVVLHVFRDSRGALWFGTAAGLSRFEDGNWTTLGRPEGLPGGVVQRITESPSGDLWFTTTGGVVRYRRSDREPPAPTLFLRTARGRAPLSGSNHAPLRIELGSVQALEWDLVGYGTPGEQRKYAQSVQAGHPLPAELEGRAGWTHVVGRHGLEWAPASVGPWTVAVRHVDRDGHRSAVALARFEVFLPWYRNRAVMIPLVVVNVGLLTWAFVARSLYRRKRHEAGQLRERMYAQEHRALLEAESNNRELAVARDAADAANRSKSQFLANMSHELRTPLTAIIGFSEMLLAEAEADQRREAVEDLGRIHGSATHLLGLINDILDLSKIEAQRMDIHLETVDLARLAREAITTLQPIARRRRDEVRFECPGDLPPVVTDPVKLRQSLLNLLGNACKFTEDGTVTLSIRHRAAGDSGTPAVVEISVRDTGIGMSAELIGRLFQPFSQAEPATARKYGGTGLGLAITRRFVEMLGGSIAVESSPGAGSLFTIVLPVAPSPAATPPGTGPATAPLASPAPTAAPDGRPVVLVIDDDPHVHPLIEKSLRDLEVTVLRAPSGAQALAFARECRPAVITLDVLMPQPDGWTLLGAIKADPLLGTVPVVMISVVGEKEMGFALGASDYLLKPIDRAQLVETLGKHLPTRFPPKPSSSS